MSIQDHTNKTRANNIRAVANQPSRKKKVGEEASQFAGNPPEAVQLRKLQEAAENSPQAKQVEALQDMANDSPQSRKTARFQAMAGGSPNSVVQRLLMERSPGGPVMRQQALVEEEAQPSALQLQGLANEEPTQSESALREAQTQSKNLVVSAPLTPLNKQSSPLQLLTQAQIAGLPKGAIDEVRSTFGPHADAILKAAPNGETLRKWLDEMQAINGRVRSAAQNVASPSLDARQTAEDQRIHTEVLAEREAKLKGFLAHASGTASAWGLSTARPHAALTEPLTDTTPSVPATLPAVATITESYTNHGDYTGSHPLTRGDLAAYVRDNNGQFSHTGSAGGGEAYQLYLGDVATSDASASWYITVVYYPDSKSARITHFGPFGAKTSAAIDKASGNI